MRILVVSGIWPPDVGGPASHAPEVAGFLAGRGHEVEAVVTASRPPAPRPFPVRWTTRRLPVGLRHAASAALVAARARPADVVYSTGMFARSSAGATAARTPLVLKLTADPAFERARARGLYHGPLDGFEASAAGAPLRALRNAALRRAARIVCPSAFLRDLVVSWGFAAERVEVVPNPAPAPPAGERAELRAELGLTGPTLAFAGRLTAQKALADALAALAVVDGVTLVIAGDGPERPQLERQRAQLGLEKRVRLLGPLPRERVLELYRAADAALLSSTWENFPHAVVEALAAGTPVIATATGGVAEIVDDGANGLLVPPGDPTALAAAVARFFADEALRARLAGAAARSVEPFAAERVYGRLEEILREAAA